MKNRLYIDRLSTDSNSIIAAAVESAKNKDSTIHNEKPVYFDDKIVKFQRSLTKQTAELHQYGKKYRALSY